MKWYLSFTDEEVFWWWPSLRRKRRRDLQTLFTADILKATPCTRASSGRESPKFLGWEKVLHPSQPVVATGEIPQPTNTSRLNVGSNHISRMIPIKPPASPPRTPTPPKPSLPAQALALVQLPTPLHAFSRVMACLPDARTHRGGP